MNDLFEYISDENSWIHSFQNHPIFSLSEREQEGIRNIKNKKLLIAIRQTEVFVAVDKTIRYTDLKECKLDEFQKNYKMNYKEFKLSKINFCIERLIINTCGSILVVIGAYDLAVIFLPTYLNSLEGNNLRINEVGRKYYGETEIVSVLFHPASKNSNTILVLSSDAVIRYYIYLFKYFLIIRVFELSLSFEESEQAIDLISRTGRTRKKGSFVVNEDIFQVSDFCFDSKANEWSLFTLHVLLQNGDIYSICPLIPSNCMVQRAYLDRLACYISTKTQQLNKIKNDPTLISHEEENMRLQTRWISDILGQISLINDYGLGSPLSQSLDAHDLVTFSRPNISRFPVLVQGPFLFQPAPLEFSSKHVMASNIIALGTNTIGILAISYTDGKIDICIEVDRIEPKWFLNKNEQYQSTNYLSTYESIMVMDSKNVLKPTENNVKDSFLIRDLRRADTFYFYYKTSIYSIMLGWLEKLEKEDNIESKTIDTLLSEGIQHSSVSKLIDMTPLSCPLPTIIGYDFLMHAYFGYSLIFWSTAFHCTVIELDITNQIQSENILTEFTKDTNVSEKNEHLKYFSLITFPIYSISQESLDFLKQSFHTTVPSEFRNKFVASQESLRFLGKIALETRKNSEKLHNLIVSMYRRLELQGQEFTRQLEKLYTLKDKIDIITSKTSSERLKNAIDNQKILQKRADQILQKLVKSHSPTLSDHEKKWFNELKRIKMKTYGNKGFNEKIQLVSIILFKILF
ncbi:unnamed protein product [Pneumocystis jirovecii]|uniref:Nucleoporin Nup82 n=1 Tax=Pneumocystis jirovecii TaxID=42068 RepID=L0PCN0_PNEJI|nr:unnamed protein product [Pneumocystis jirovecii]